MKTIALDRAADGAVAAPPEFTLFPDSSLVLNGNPVFIPAFARDWTARVYLAFRICRLGKTIAPKFAPRYRDAVTAAVRIVPDDIRRVFASSDADPGLLGSFDNALALGKWLPIPDDGRIRLEFGDVKQEFTLESCAIDRTISILSNYMTLKMGDVVMPVRIAAASPVAQGSEIAVTINGADACTARFK